MFTRTMGGRSHAVCGVVIVCMAFGVGCGPVARKFYPQPVSVTLTSPQLAPATPALPQLATPTPTTRPLRTQTPGSTPPGTATTVPPRATPTLNRTPVNESPAFFVSALVKAEAIKRTGAAPSSVSIVNIEAMEWPDAGLGCGQPGQGYVQMTTPGWLVEVKAASKTLEYHTDQTASKIVLCKENG